MKSKSLVCSLLLLGACFALVAPGLLRAEGATRGPAKALPRLVDLGAGKCVPCKQMKPILDELMRDYADQFETVFIDVWENREEGAKYGIRIIPTQIFYTADGVERFRHEGFMSKKDILAKWRALGVEVREPAAQEKR
jgi:thioredoxin 1